jgi:hypothetical protein
MVDTQVAPAGRVSVIDTPVAELGPLFVTVIVYVRFCPTITGSGESVLVIDRLAAGFTVVVVVQLLLPVFGSVTPLVTLAVLLSVPTAAAPGVTTMVTVALAPLAKVPIEQVIVAVPVQLPGLDVAETNVTFAGKVSVTVTPVAALGPLLVTRMLYVRFWPANTGSGESLLVSARFAAALTVLLVVEVLLPDTGSPTLLDTVAVLLSVPTAPAPGVTTMVTVALAPLFSVPMEQVTVAVPLQVPDVDAAETNVTVAGRVSLTLTPVAVLGPALFTVMV